MTHKKIAIFSDGTGNSSAKLQKTNVWRVYKSLDLSSAAQQIAFYDDGVGTSSFRPLAMLGGAFGFGLARNVRQIYGFVCRTYKPGDEIYGFGFSRGAFTMRVVVAFIAHQGIIDPEKTRGERDLDRLIRAAYRRFRRESFSNAGLAFFLRPVRNLLIWIKDIIFGHEPYKPKKNHEYPGNDRASPYLIRFLGVWDTVDAYGLPIDEMTRAYDRMVWPLSAKDRNLSSRVQRACHALALDEQRESFEPMLWNEGGEPHTTHSHISDERLTQIWFAGVHSNVGGGYADDALSHVALNWIMEESTRQDGLKFLPHEHLRLRNAADLNGPAYDSRRGIGSFYRYQPRNLEKLCNGKNPGLENQIRSWLVTGLEKLRNGKESGLVCRLHARLISRLNMNEVKVSRPKIHHTVFERLPTGGDAYAPINLPVDYAVVQPDGRILDVKDSRKMDNGDIDLGDGSILKPDGTICPAAGPVVTCQIQSPDGNTLDDRYKLFEDGATAEQRGKSQKLVWNKIWLRRVVYHLTLITTAVFLAFPFVAPELPESTRADVGITTVNDSLDSLLGTLNLAIKAVPEMVSNLPGLGFARGFLEQYVEYPYFFCILLIITGLLVIWSRKLKATINDDMRSIWEQIARTGNTPPAPAGGLKHSLASIRDSRFYDKGIARPIRLFTELLMFVFFAVVVFAVMSRVSLIVLDGTGRICPATDPQQQVSPDAGGVTFDFPANSTCLAAAVEVGKSRHYVALQEDRHYWIEMQLGDNWTDGDDPGIKSDIFGWIDAPSYMSVFTPLRRHLLVDWYQPVARINNKLFDRYPLLAEKTPPADPERGETCLRHKIRARNTGQLYLYLNDAVLFSTNLPSRRLAFYANNHGDAMVRVTLTDADSDSPAAPLCKISSHNEQRFSET